MNAPDRIFAEEPDVFDGMGLWHSEGPYAEYIRADLHDTALAAAKAEGIREGVAGMSCWEPIETAPKDGTTVLLFTTCHGVCEAWFSKGEWSDDTPIAPAEYSGPVWVCCDDAFQIEVEEGATEHGGDHHGTATHWMSLPSLPEATT